MTTEEQGVPNDIYLLTTDALLADLISGRAVTINANNQFSLNTNTARAVLDWYSRNRGKRAGNLTAPDTESIVDSVSAPLPTAEPHIQQVAGASPRVLRLTKIVAHRFAGLHAYGRTTSPADRYIFEPHKTVTLFEGANGSGKTSIANAVVWCLTGHLIRSQRPPEEGPTEFACEIEREDKTISTHNMSAITPMPHASSDLPNQGDPIPADSWVELTFADADGTLLPPIRRQQGRTARGKLAESPPDFEPYGVPSIAWRIATIMPALLPFLSVGSAPILPAAAPGGARVLVVVSAAHGGEGFMYPAARDAPSAD